MQILPIHKQSSETRNAGIFYSNTWKRRIEERYRDISKNLTELLIMQNACLPIANPYHFYYLCQSVSPNYQLAGSCFENLLSSVFKRENDWYNCMYERN